MNTNLTHSDFQALAEFRYQIRRFLAFSEEAARSAGLEPGQHQFMLALKGLPSQSRPRVIDLAERLHIQHPSAVEMADRLARGGYIRRVPAKQDRREVLLSLTAKGERVLSQLSMHHHAELQKNGPALIAALRRIVEFGVAADDRPALAARPPEQKTLSLRSRPTKWRSL